MNLANDSRNSASSRRDFLKIGLLGVPFLLGGCMGIENGVRNLANDALSIPGGIAGTHNYANGGSGGNNGYSNQGFSSRQVNPFDIQLIHPHFGRIDAFFAAKNLVAGSGERQNYLDVGAAPTRERDTPFVVKAQHLMGAPKIAIYDGNFSPIMDHTFEGVQALVGGEIRTSTFQKGKYIFVVSGRSVRPGLLASMAKPTGDYMKVVEMPFELS